MRKNTCIIALALLLVSVPLLVFSEGSGTKDHEWHPFEMPEIKSTSFPDRDFVITDFGAVAGGGNDNTGAFAEAIKTCSEAGGGRVVVPAGEWTSGPIHLLSNVELHLSEGAEIIFSDDPEDYLPPVFTRWEGVECYNYSPLVYAHKQENVAITGKGVLNGRGAAWWPWKFSEDRATDLLLEYGKNDTPVEERMFASPDLPLRPPMVQFVECDRVLLSGYTGINSPFWTNHLVYCTNIIVDGVRVLAPPSSPNTDGVNLDSCENAIVKDIYVDTGDDAVCVKSGRNEDGWRVGRPTRNVLITGTKSFHTHGGFVVGSEMSGGIENIIVRDCEYNGTMRGIRIKSKRGRGGYVKNVWVEDIRMGRITRQAITVTMKYSYGVDDDKGQAPVYENINIRNVTCESARTAILVEGLPDSKVKGLHIEKVDIKSMRGAVVEHASGVTLRSARIDPTFGPVVTAKNSTDVLIEDMVAPALTPVFMKVAGKESAGIRIVDSDLSGALVKKMTISGAPDDAVTIRP